MSNKYIVRRKKPGTKDTYEYVVKQRGTGKVLSRHTSRAKAEGSFRAIEFHKHNPGKK